jgi:hypothetical protein
MKTSHRVQHAQAKIGTLLKLNPTEKTTFDDLESPVSDLASMADVTATMMEAVGQSAASPDAKFRDGYCIVRNSDIDRLLFCAYHLNEMAKDLKSQYFAVLEAE